MKKEKRPTLKNGKISFLEIPTRNIEQSVNFYKNVFGWRIRTRSDGKIAFDDTVNEVSGTWVTGRKASTIQGLLIYILVDNVKTTLELIVSNGGKIIQPIGHDSPEITARFADPFGNILGIFQQ